MEKNVVNFKKNELTIALNSVRIVIQTSYNYIANIPYPLDMAYMPYIRDLEALEAKLKLLLDEEEDVEDAPKAPQKAG